MQILNKALELIDGADVFGPPDCVCKADVEAAAGSTLAVIPMVDTAG